MKYLASDILGPQVMNEWYYESFAATASPENMLTTREHNEKGGDHSIEFRRTLPPQQLFNSEIPQSINNFNTEIKERIRNEAPSQ